MRDSSQRSIKELYDTGFLLKASTNRRDQLEDPSLGTALYCTSTVQCSTLVSTSYACNVQYLG